MLQADLLRAVAWFPRSPISSSEYNSALLPVTNQKQSYKYTQTAAEWAASCIPFSVCAQRSSICAGISCPTLISGLCPPPLSLHTVTCTVFPHFPTYSVLSEARLFFFCVCVCSIQIHWPHWSTPLFTWADMVSRSSAQSFFRSLLFPDLSGVSYFSLIKKKTFPENSIFSTVFTAFCGKYSAKSLHP